MLCVLSDFSSGEVKSLSATGAHTLNFVKEDDTWYNADDREMNLDQTEISALIKQYRSYHHGYSSGNTGKSGGIRAG